MPKITLRSQIAKRWVGIKNIFEKYYAKAPGRQAITSLCAFA